MYDRLLHWPRKSTDNRDDKCQIFGIACTFAHHVENHVYECILRFGWSPVSRLILIAKARSCSWWSLRGEMITPATDKIRVVCRMFWGSIFSESFGADLDWQRYPCNASCTESKSHRNLRWRDISIVEGLSTVGDGSRRLSPLRHMSSLSPQNSDWAGNQAYKNGQNRSTPGEWLKIVSRMFHCSVAGNDCPASS
jgi:hypothetical protein